MDGVATLFLNCRCNLCDVQFECLSGVTLINLIILLRKHLKETHSEMAKQGEYISDVATFKLNEFKHRLEWPQVLQVVVWAISRKIKNVGTK